MAPFTVIVPTHERPDLLRRAIASVKDQGAGLAQLVVVSDIWCAETYELVTPLLGSDDCFVQRTGKPGPAESRNFGIRFAQGRFVLFLDDDDALSSGYLASAIAQVSAGDVVYTNFLDVVEKRERDLSTIVSFERRSLAKFDIETVYIRNFIPLSCLVYPYEAIACRRFDSVIAYEDWDFILNVAADFSLRHVEVDGPIIYRRDQPDNRGHSNNAYLEQTYRQIYKRWPAPSEKHKLHRQELMKSAGLLVSIDEV